MSNSYRKEERGEENDSTNNNDNRSTTRRNNRRRINNNHNDNRSFDEIYNEALNKLQTKPNLVHCFSRVDCREQTMNDYLSSRDQNNNNIISMSTPFVDVKSMYVQYSFNDDIESKSQYGTLFGHFPNSRIEAFHYDESRESSCGHYLAYLAYLERENVTWKAFFVYVCGDIQDLCVRNFIEGLRRINSEAVIVGGHCHEGYVSYKQNNGTYGRKKIEDGIFGLAMGGEIPMKSVVSRGITSLVQQDGKPQATSPIRVTMPTSDDNYFSLSRFKDSTAGSRALTFLDLIQRYSQPDFIGIRRDNEDGFRIHDLNEDFFDRNMILVPNIGESYLNAEIDFYDLDGEACKDDMRSKVPLLRQQTNDEQILGSLMFTCNGRGPDPGDLIDTAMYDATCFSNTFPQVPCLGFYAGGEIGPEVIVASRQNAAFRNGNPKIQAFTAVFALFIVPNVDRWTRHKLDDSPEYVKAFCMDKLTSAARPKSK